MKKIFFALFISCVTIFNLAANDESWFKSKFPAKLLKGPKKEIDTETALQGKMVALYFSASWCGPCRSFTPQLVNFYKHASKRGNLEIILVSSDKNEQDMLAYIKKYNMPWTTIPFNDKSRAQLKKEFNVNGIPTLVVLNSHGKVISKNARWDVVIMKNKAINAWKSSEYTPKTYKDFQQKRPKKSTKKSSKKQKSK